MLGEQRGATRFEAVHGASSLPMISREDEIARLVDRATAALLGQGQIVVITGEAGIGKSRLIEEMHRRLEIKPEQRVVLQCSPIHTNRPFHPVAHYLDYMTGVEAPDADVRQLDRLDALLRRLGQATPERLALIAELLRRESSDRRLLLRLAPTEIRARTIEALLDIVEAISRESPVIVIEDVHWADPSTNEWLERLAGMIRGLPVLLVATMRPGEMPQWAEQSGASILQLVAPAARRDQAAGQQRCRRAQDADQRGRCDRGAFGRHSDLRRGTGARPAGDGGRLARHGRCHRHSRDARTKSCWRGSTCSSMAARPRSLRPRSAATSRSTC